MLMLSSLPYDIICPMLLCEFQIEFVDLTIVNKVLIS